jgi:hypothetical protein
MNICHRVNSALTRLPDWMRGSLGFQLFSLFLAFGLVVIVANVGLFVIPKKFYAHPYFNFISYYELCYALFLSLYGAYLCICYYFGLNKLHYTPVSPSLSSSSESKTLSNDSIMFGGGPGKPHRETTFYTVFFVTYPAVVLCYLLEAEELALYPKKKVWYMIVLGMIAVAFVTVAFIRLPSIWYRYGLKTKS